jgi:1D-myo-inositol-triphosphate 3-kinase
LLFQIIGSSILIMFDAHCKCNAWMIDFAKTLQFPDHSLDHRTPWQVGNHEDGYLVGIDNLLQVRGGACRA